MANYNIIGLIIFAFIGAIVIFFRAYLKKKGENLADKQDAKQIEENKHQAKNISDMNTLLWHLLIKADNAIIKEEENYDIYGCGSAFDDIYALSKYLVTYNVYYKKNKNARKIIDAHVDLYNLQKESDKQNRFIEPEYERIISNIYPYIQRLKDEYTPQ